MLYRKSILAVPDSPPLLGVLGAWMTFRKTEMAKTLSNGLNMSEMEPLNYKRLDFAILLELALHQFQEKNLLLSHSHFSYLLPKL